jgi:hypothetical protein
MAREIPFSDILNNVYNFDKIVADVLKMVFP